MVIIRINLISRRPLPVSLLNNLLKFPLLYRWSLLLPIILPAKLEFAPDAIPHLSEQLLATPFADDGIALLRLDRLLNMLGITGGTDGGGSARF